MNSLPKPSMEVSAAEIFALCASGFSDETLKKNLLSCVSFVEEDSTQFVSSFVDSILSIEKNRTLPNKVSKSQMEKIYTCKFASKGSPGRKYYDLLMSVPKGRRCPICGERIVRNLDHYMPKSVYTTLIVTPENLIPVCRDCNFDKLTFTISNTEDAPLHPYFDNIDSEIWLSVKLLSNQTAIYDVTCPDTWCATLKQRVKNHLRLFSLDEFYGIKAGQEIADEIWGWRKILNENGSIQLLDHLKMRCKSIEKNQLNSWKSALYRGLINQYNIFLNWFII